MCNLFRKSKFKKIVIGIVLATFLAAPSTAMVQPKGGGFLNFIVKTSSFMLKEGIKENKKKKAQAELKVKEDRRKAKIALREFKYDKKYFPNLSFEDMIGVSNLLDNMLDGYCKDVTDLSEAQLKARIRSRLKNKKLSESKHKELEKYIEKKIYLNKIFNYEGEGYVTVSPSGVITFTSPATVFAY